MTDAWVWLTPGREPVEQVDVLLYLAGSSRAPFVVGHLLDGEWYEGAPVGEAYFPVDVAPVAWQALRAPDGWDGR